MQFARSVRPDDQLAPECLHSMGSAFPEGRGEAKAVPAPSESARHIVDLDLTDGIGGTHVCFLSGGASER
jgi:hypothetical protein